MAHVVMRNEKTGMEKTIKKGFSWTVFFFGGIALIIRGQVKNLLIWLVLSFLFVIPGIIYGWYLAFKANDELIDELGKKGYQIV